MGKDISQDYFLTVAGTAQAEIKVRGSVFIGTLAPVKDRTRAESFLDDTRKTYYDATHNCFAYRISETDYRFSDDGEPSGTAGKPILQVLEKNKLLRVALVVTRYFGGTKLGTGGLIRAYSQCAREVVLQAEIKRQNCYWQQRVAYPFSLINKVQHLVHKYHACIREDASSEGMLAEIDIPPSRFKDFKQELLTVTSGKIKFL